MSDEGYDSGYGEGYTDGQNDMEAMLEVKIEELKTNFCLLLNTIRDKIDNVESEV